MNEDFIKKFEKSLKTGFIDKAIHSESLYRPKLLVNSKKPKKKVLTSILKEFQNCESFYISVAFATTGGVAAIINSLQILQEKGIYGKILVSQYLNFTQPEALRRLLQFNNIELRIATKGESHSKGYIFKTKECYNLIIGSSNLTQNALASNKEWNLQVSAISESEIAHKLIQEFDEDFEEGTIVTEQFIEEYQRIYQRQKLFRSENQRREELGSTQKIEPNLMQSEALENLRELRGSGKTKALVISATGTGKTFLSAFDVKAFKTKKLLFVVHRLNIAQKAMETFQRIFGKEKSFGIYSGGKREKDKDFVFSTVQTISKTPHLNQFEKDHFDYIIIDESHRSGAKSYNSILNYFEPRFLLGMTATPERTDGNDIYKLFDHNVAYEIRLNRAMEENLLAPFHYYGVSDFSINEKEEDDFSLFNKLTSDERVDKIIAKSKFYGTDNGLLRGLIFVSKKDEAKELSKKFNKKGLKTIALDGDSTEDQRNEAIRRLESDVLSEKLDYIFTIDIFNEGIDIPKVNQIIMLRPTTSAIIFVQQLGRGLRKIDEKSYLTVIDFIGNYSNNYLIPMALYGDSSYNKDKLRKLISEGSREISGVSTINFDRISKEKIFESISSANMKLLKELRNDYIGLRNRLGRIPMMMDFFETETREPFLYVEHSKSYYNFVEKVEKFESALFDEKSKLILKYFSIDINNAKRIEESYLLKSLLQKEEIRVDDFQKLIEDDFGFYPSIETIDSVINNINLNFIREKKEGKLIPVNEIYETDIVQVLGGKILFTDNFKKLLNNGEFKKFVIDNTDYSISSYAKNFDSNKWEDGFILYNKYSRKDVFRILNYDTNPVAQNVGGYLVSNDFKTCPIFVNYHKEEDISESTKYEDEFINNSTFSWMSKSNRKLDSKDVVAILGKKGEIRLPLFIKKNNDEGKDFYYMGEIIPKQDHVEQTTMMSDSGKSVSVVRIVFDMKTPVSDSMYDYLIEPIHNSNHIIKAEIESKREAIEFVQPKPTIPLYNFYAAASTFSEMQSDKSSELIEVPDKYSNSEYFACEIKGDSMNRRIPNGSICIFKKYSGGSRNGKIVLVENYDRQDPDFNSAFTVKTYISEKTVTEEGWSHNQIVLRPNSYNDSYKDIIIDEESGANMRVVGEFVAVL